MKRALTGSAGLALALVATQARAEPLVVDHGRLFLAAAVNGVATEALLDSGAEATLVDDRFASEVKLAEGTPLTISGLDGAAPARAVGGASIQMLGLTVRPEVVVVTDLDEFSARLVKRPTRLIIGREFFGAVRLLIDIQGRSIAVVPKTYQPAGERLQLTDHAGIEAIPVRADGVAAEAGLDFGNGSDVLISRALAQRLRLKTVARKSGGAIGGKLERDLVILDSLDVAGVKFRNVTAAVDEQPAAADLNLGTDILGRFRITTDFAAGTVWLQPEGHSAGATGSASAAGGSAGEDLVCEFRTPIGSHLRTRVCRTKEQIKREADEAERVMRRIPRSGPTTD